MTISKNDRPIRIPVYRPHFSGQEREHVLNCLETGWISWRGPYVDRFEKECADFVGARHVNCVANGTVALHLALLALGISSGDEVLVPTLTYIASVNAISYVGARPIFCDSSRTSWQLDPNDIEARVTPRTKAILVVHLYGQPAPMLEIMALAKRYGLFVIEDAAEALGSKIGENHVGTFGDVSTFSFFGNKVITTGEGGLVVTRSESLHREVSLLKSQYVSQTKQYWHEKIGFNYRMTNVQAAIGVGQLADLNWIIRRKREIAAHYENSLSGLPVEFHRELPGTTHNFWMCSILLQSGELRAALMKHLESCGIETRPVFYPAHTMPMYYEEANSRYFPVAEDLSIRGINLPSFPDLTDAEIEEVCAEIRCFCLRNEDHTKTSAETCG